MSQVFAWRSGRGGPSGPARRSSPLARAACLLVAALLAAATLPGSAPGAPTDAPGYAARCDATPAPPTSPDVPRPWLLLRGGALGGGGVRPVADERGLGARCDTSTAPASPALARWSLSHGTSTSLP